MNAPHSRSPLAALFAAPGKFDFFQAVRLLERLAATDGRAKNGTAASNNDMANGGNAPERGWCLTGVESKQMIFGKPTPTLPSSGRLVKVSESRKLMSSTGETVWPKSTCISRSRGT